MKILLYASFAVLLTSGISLAQQPSPIDYGAEEPESAFATGICKNMASTQEGQQFCLPDYVATYTEKWEAPSNQIGKVVAEFEHKPIIADQNAMNTAMQQILQSPPIELPSFK